MPRKEKRDVKETNRKYRSGSGKSRYKEILPKCELVQERIQPRLNACRDNSGKLIQGDDKIIEHWDGYFKTQCEKEYSEEECDEEMFLTAKPLVNKQSQEEIEKAICNLKINKAPREDDITVELIKNASQELKKRLHALICKIGRDGKMPDDWKVGLIVPLFKKGDKMNCENYRGITLLNVAYKILPRIILERLKEYSKEILGVYQCGFRPQRRTDQIFVVRQILEQFYAHDIDLHIHLIDFKKAFDSINQKKLLESLVSFGIPRKI